MRDERPTRTDDAITLCAQGRALWHELRRTALAARSPENLAWRPSIAVACQELVLAFSPPSDQQAMRDAIETGALVLYEAAYAAL